MMRFKKYKKIKISLTNLNLNNKEITKNNFGKMAETKKTFFNKFKSFYGLKPEISNLRADCSKSTSPTGKNAPLNHQQL